MRKLSFHLTAAIGGLSLLAASASAVLASDPAPKVVASIPALHSLAFGVMQGVSSPFLLLRGGASPHSYAMRPSEARALSEADLVFWVGPELEGFLVRSLENRPASRPAVALLRAAGVTRLALRRSENWGTHDHGHDHHHDHHDHAADDSAAHDHDDHDEHDDHEGHKDDKDHDEHADDAGHHAKADRHDDDGHDKDSHAEHGHDAHDADDAPPFDPHIWLDPDNAIAMTRAMADALAKLDPARATIYRENEQAQVARLAALSGEIAQTLQAVRSRPYVVFHDGYQYFEHAFGTNAIGAVSVSPGSSPGAGRLARLRRTLQEGGALCIFAEPQFEPRLVRSVTEGTGVRTGTLDPLGSALEPGPDAYFALLRTMAESMRDCLAIATD